MRILALSFGEILREFGEILGKYRMLNGRSVGSKRLKHTQGKSPSCAQCVERAS